MSVSFAGRAVIVTGAGGVAAEWTGGDLTKGGNVISITKAATA